MTFPVSIDQLFVNIFDELIHRLMSVVAGHAGMQALPCLLNPIVVRTVDHRSGSAPPTTRR